MEGGKQVCLTLIHDDFNAPSLILPHHISNSSVTSNVGKRSFARFISRRPAFEAANFAAISEVCWTSDSKCGVAFWVTSFLCIWQCAKCTQNAIHKCLAIFVQFYFETLSNCGGNCGTTTNEPGVWNVIVRPKFDLCIPTLKFHNKGQKNRLIWSLRAHLANKNDNADKAGNSFSSLPKNVCVN